MAAEAVFGFREEHGCWPLWDDATEYLSASPVAPCDLDEAERRLRQAILDEEVVAAPIRGGAGWLLKLTDQMAARLERRYLDATMPRIEGEAC